MKHWPDSKLNFEDYTTAKSHMVQIQNICAQARLTTAELLRIDLNRIRGKQTNGEVKVPWADVSIRPRIILHKAVDDCLALIGFKSVLDEETVVSAEEFEENSAAILKLCRSSSAARGVRLRTTDPALALKRALTENFGIHLVKVRKREGNNMKFVWYSLKKDEDVHRLAHSSDFFLKKEPNESVDYEMMDTIWHLMRTLSSSSDTCISFERALCEPAMTVAVEKYGLNVCNKTWGEIRLADC
jgi:hypothetical protein